ncbi:hypothetical protein Tsubulata_012873 [Turnera subulata]|uniref:UBC core domain-containing protein n=1 Tax=Turnera subulata TaxID=218843 RepID=A0A9Q0G514_9ROSI|nr:hypothetical protein Tsubulata_012873 [Turnera subulata]
MDQGIRTARIQSELKLIKQDPPPNCSVDVEPPMDDINNWEAVIIGPRATPYEGGLFRVAIHFPAGYPIDPPKVSFKTKIYHPNIGRNGAMCRDLTKGNWGRSQHNFKCASCRGFVVATTES